MLKIRLLTILILSLTSYTSFCQIFDADQNPPGLNWRQINTENFQVIYPSGLDPEAKRLSGMLDDLIIKVSASLKKQPRKISIILQNQGTTSNGFVQLAPRRSEFFTTPPQEFDYQNWLNSLAVHELRHVVQFDKLTGGFKAPFFEGLALAIFGITLPPWFYEGDAVGTETSLTAAGRGRQPEWDIAFRTNTLSGKKFSYSKDFMGSLKDLTPGYYQLGYYMTSKLRRDYGPGIMDSIFTRMSGNYARPYNLSSSVNKFTGLNTAELHRATVEELQGLWRGQLLKAKPLNYPALNSRTDSNPVSYLLPALLPSGEIVALKKTVNKLPAIVKISPDGSELKIAKIGPQEQPHFSYSAGRIVWDEFRYDLRFHKRSYNVIMRYDLKKQRYKQLSNRSRLFSPSLSPDGKTIIAVDISYSNKISLVELDAENGRELKRYSSPGNLMLQTPRFDPGGKKIVVVAADTPGKAIYELDRTGSTFIELLPFQQQLISRPVYAGDQIVFKAHYNGIDNLYRLDPVTKAIYQLTSSPYGVLNPSYDESSQKLLFNNYQLGGYDVASLPFDKNSGTTIPVSTSVHYEQPLVVQEGNQNVFDDPPNKNYESKPYRETANLFYFHSLVPVLEENVYTGDYNYGLKIQSDNKLNTLSFYGGYQFNYGLKKSEYLAGFSYKRFYPVLSLTYSNTAQVFYRTTSGSAPIAVSWRNNQTDAEISVPFAFNRLNKSYFLQFSSGTSYIKRYQVLNRPSNFNNTVSFPIRYLISLKANTRQTARDLAPKWGQNIFVDFRNFPLTNQIDGELFSIRTNFFFPGLISNHSFQASFNYQHGSGIYELIAGIPRINGYDNLRPIANLRNTLLLDYRFPLFYPDWEIGPLAYIKRFKAGFFADFENIGKGAAFAPRTYGAELRADMNLLRFYLPDFDLAGKIILVNEKPRQNPIFGFGITYNY